MVRARTPGRDPASAIDAGIVTTGCTVASWVFVMSPLLSHEDALAAWVVALADPAGNVLVLAVGVRLSAGPPARGRRTGGSASTCSSSSSLTRPSPSSTWPHVPMRELT